MRIIDWSSDVCSSDLLPSAQPSNVQASCLERARPAASSHWFARSPARWLLAQQRRRAAAARSDSEGQRRKARQKDAAPGRSEQHTSELQSLMRISYAVFCLKNKKQLANNENVC